jgi:putative acetyltransferase
LDAQTHKDRGKSNITNILIEPFRAEDQAAVKKLILDGLVEHWGWLDESKNPDLVDIATHYAEAFFLVARLNDQVIGTGALVPMSEGTGEIVRMSVAATYRRQGLGRLILQHLLRHARREGMNRIILETTAAWTEVIAFYQRSGFELSYYEDGDAYFYLELLPETGPANVHNRR